MKKKFIAVLLLFLIVVSIVPSVYAEKGTGISDLMSEKPNDAFGYDNANFKIAGITDKHASGTQESLWGNILTNYKGVITGIAGAVALTFLVFFILNISKLGSSAGNPQMRQQALMGIVWCGVACACAGGIGIFFGFFYNAIK